MNVGVELTTRNHASAASSAHTRVGVTVGAATGGVVGATVGAATGVVVVVVTACGHMEEKEGAEVEVRARCVNSVSFS